MDQAKTYLKRSRKTLLKILQSDGEMVIKGYTDEKDNPDHPLSMFYQDLERALDHLEEFLEQEYDYPALDKNESLW